MKHKNKEMSTLPSAALKTDMKIIQIVQALYKDKADREGNNHTAKSSIMKRIKYSRRSGMQGR